MTRITTTLLAVCALLSGARCAEAVVVRPSRDATAALQAAVDSVRTRHESIYLVGGDYVITDTINCPVVWGLRINGTAPSEDSGNTKLHGATTRIIWKGPPDRPMMQFAGRELIVDGVAFLGKPRSDEDGQRAAVGLQITSVRGVGTGEITLRNVLFVHCEQAIRVGDNVNDHNCDTIVYDNVNFSRCGTGVELNNHQAVAHDFRFVVLAYTDCFLDVKAGGIANANNVQVLTPTTLLRIGKPGPGSFTGAFAFANVHLDAVAAGPGMRLVDMQDQSPVRISFTNLHLPGREFDEPLLVLQGHAGLSIRDSYGLPDQSISAAATDRGKPWVIVEGSWVHPPLLAEGADCDYSFRDNFGGPYPGEPLPDERDWGAGSNATP